MNFPATAFERVCAALMLMTLGALLFVAYQRDMLKIYLGALVAGTLVGLVTGRKK